VAVLPGPTARRIRRPGSTLTTPTPERATVRLLGKPAITVAGRPRDLPGRKPWALLAILCLDERGVSRAELADRIWTEADDPRAALRWALVQLRRALPDQALAERDGRLRLARSSNVVVDALRLLEGTLDPAEIEVGVGGELLEGFSFDAPDLDRWLALERSRIRSASAEALRWAVTRRLDVDPPGALRLAERAARLDPYDDAVHELIVDAHVRIGDRDGARAYAAQVRRLYLTDLGTEAPATIERPLERPVVSEAVEVGAAAEAPARLELARARLGAGDYEGAVRIGREAVAAAIGGADRNAEARASLALASILIHSVRGHDQETHGLLRRTLELAMTAEDQGLAAETELEIGYLHFLEADYGAAELALARAVRLAEEAGDRVLAGRALTMLGASQSDRADFQAALETLQRAVSLLGPMTDRWVGYAKSFQARVALRAGRPGAAAATATESLADARRVGWTSLVPWPMAILGEAQLALGEVDTASSTFEEALVIAREIRDPCWEALALRGLALVAARNGDLVRAEELLGRGLACARRLPDSYDWAEAVVLTDLVELECGRDPEHLAAAVRIVERGPMPDLARRVAAALPSQTPTQPVAS
jgi:DNA-binding SARP family transcriptional activator